jgi:hypothetical protein
VAERPKVQIDLTPPLLSFVIEAARAADPATADLVAGIENVRVRVYEIGEDESELLGFIDDASGDLERAGWQRAIYVDDEQSKVRVYMMLEDENATGLTMMVAGHDGEAVFINVSGLINPTQLGTLMNAVGAGDALSQVTGFRPGDGPPPAEE